MQKFFLNSNPAPLEILEIGNAAGPIPSDTRKCSRMFTRKDVEKGDIIVVWELLPNLFRKEQVVAPRSTATKKPNTLMPPNAEKDEKYYHQNGEKYLPNKQAAVLPNRTKEQAVFDENVFSQCTRSGKTLVDYHDEKLELQSTSVSAYL